MLQLGLQNRSSHWKPDCRDSITTEMKAFPSAALQPNADKHKEGFTPPHSAPSSGGQSPLKSLLEEQRLLLLRVLLTHNWCYQASSVSLPPPVTPFQCRILGGSYPHHAYHTSGSILCNSTCPPITKHPARDAFLQPYSHAEQPAAILSQTPLKWQSFPYVCVSCLPFLSQRIKTMEIAAH